MERIIYIANEEDTTPGGNIENLAVTYDREEAVKEAKYIWRHLTKREQKTTRVYVSVYTVELEEGDARTAKEVYYDMVDDDTFPADCDRIDIED